MTREETVHTAMVNSYDVLMGKRTFIEIVDEGFGIFAFRPTEGINYETLQLMLEYFETTEMYEECKDIKYIIDTLPSKDYIITVD
jgi:hypothetical protein